MFLGHIGLGLAAKKSVPQINAGWLIVSAGFLDIVWPILVSFGIEHFEVTPGITKINALNFTDYPWSHSLLMATLWGVLVSLVGFGIMKLARVTFSPALPSIVLGLLVLSHWFLDLPVHRPDLPLSPGSELKFGLGGWNSWVVALGLESLFWIGGIIIYLKTTKAKDRIGTTGFWSFIGVLTLFYVTSLFGTPPADPMIVLAGSITIWLLFLLMWWVDRHRTVRNFFVG